jgi:hypothetical protein
MLERVERLDDLSRCTVYGIALPKSGLRLSGGEKAGDVLSKVCGLSCLIQNDAVVDMVLQEGEGGAPCLLISVRLDKRAHGKRTIDDGAHV